MQKVERKKKNLDLNFFEIEGNEFRDFMKAEEVIKNGGEIKAIGYVEVNGKEMLVRTSNIKKMVNAKNIIKLFTNNIEYSVKIS